MQEVVCSVFKDKEAITEKARPETSLSKGFPALPFYLYLK